MNMVASRMEEYIDPKIISPIEQVIHRESELAREELTRRAIAALGRLPSKFRDAMTSYCGFAGAPSTSQLAQDLNVSRQRVHQLKNDAARVLRDHLNRS